MKGGLDRESLPNFAAAARGAAERSGLSLADLDFVCLLHTKRSMFEALLSELGMTDERAVYLDDTGHMSGVDPLLGLDRACATAASRTATSCCCSRPAPATRGRQPSSAGGGSAPSTASRRRHEEPRRAGDERQVRGDERDPPPLPRLFRRRPGARARPGADGERALLRRAHARRSRGRHPRDCARHAWPGREHASTGYAMDDHARDVLGLLDALELERVAMGGHSFGGL